MTSVEDLAGQLIVVTGGSQGIGLEVSRQLAARGARVAIAARSGSAVDTAVSELSGDGHLGLRLDVSDPTAWPAAVEALDRAGPPRGLVTAAGVLGPIGQLEAVDMEQVASAISINLLGTMLALHHLIPRLRRSRGRAVTFSGGGATAPLPRYDAYAASKVAVVRLTENIAAAGVIELNCVAPGFVATSIHAGTLSAGPDAAGSEYYERTRAELQRGGVPAREAAELTCFLLSDDASGITGRLVSAPWDPWRDSAFRDRLRSESELGTLRRIDGAQFGRLA